MTAGDARGVFGEAIRQRATVTIVAHNHLSRNLKSSLEDRDVTRRLRHAEELLGIKLLDCLIFCEEGLLSMPQGESFNGTKNLLIWTYKFVN